MLLNKQIGSGTIMTQGDSSKVMQVYTAVTSGSPGDTGVLIAAEFDAVNLAGTNTKTIALKTVGDIQIASGALQFQDGSRIVTAIPSFPFSAFSFDDPNKTNPPNLRLKDPWIFDADTIADTAANLASANPTPMKGQIAYETDTKYFKLGDGSTAYNSLSYQPQYGEVAPMPQTAAGAGQFPTITAAAGSALSLPAGGMWMYWGAAYVFGTNNIGEASQVAPPSGFAAGGTQILGASAGNVPFAYAWRLL
jgi:hypothetical protein